VQCLNLQPWRSRFCWLLIPGSSRIHQRFRLHPQHTSAYVSIRQRTSAYVSIRQHTSAYLQRTSAYVGIRRHTSAYVSIRQHTSAYVSVRQHTSAYVSIRQHTSLVAAVVASIDTPVQPKLLDLPLCPVWQWFCDGCGVSFVIRCRFLSAKLQLVKNKSLLCVKGSLSQTVSSLRSLLSKASL
jgi:hypothetical protein